MVGADNRLGKEQIVSKALWDGFFVIKHAFAKLAFVINCHSKPMQRRSVVRPLVLITSVMLHLTPTP